MVLFRVWLNRPRFGIHNKNLNFYDWILCYNELCQDNRNKWQSLDLSMDLWHSNNMKVILPNFAKDHYFWTFWTLWNYVDCIPLSCIDYFLVLFSNFRKTWLNPSEKHDCYKISPVHLSICLSVRRLWCVFLRIYSVDFLNFLHEDILPYILSDQAIIWKIVFVV